MTAVVEKEGAVSASPDEAAWAALDDAVVRALGTAHEPRLRVVRGQPDEVELAALVAGIAAHRAATGPSGDGVTAASRWTDHRRRLGLPPAPGADAWRWSAR